MFRRDSRGQGSWPAVKVRENFFDVSQTFSWGQQDGVFDTFRQSKKQRSGITQTPRGLSGLLR